MIQLHNLTKSYDGKRNALDQLTLDIPEGKIYGFLGPNGAGKTTCLKLITGLLEPTAGTLTINGLNYEQDALAIKKSFAFVPDDPNVFLRLRGIEYLNFIADIYDVPANERKSRINELAGRFSLTDALSKRIQEYSHGMRQKIVLIGALLHRPSLWILDEPMTGLDPASAFILKQMMREHADQGHTVIFSTHVLDVAEKVCDELAIIADGQLRFNGTIQGLRDQLGQSGSDSLENLFLELTGQEDLLAPNEAHKEV